MQKRHSNNPHYQAYTDIIESLKLWRLACSLGWFDIKLRYKGSFVGPLWMTLTSATMVVMMGVVYGSLFHIHVAVYIPFVALSSALWQYGISITMSDGCQCFLQASDTVHSVKLPFFLQAMRTIFRNTIILSLNIIVPIVTFIIFKIWPGWAIFWVIPGLMLWLIDGLCICVLLGSICARYRDIPQIINSFIQIVFYMTPIIWLPTQLHKGAYLLLLNPLYPILEVVRAPLLGHAPPLYVWLCAIGYSTIVWVVSWSVFVRARRRLAFWI